MALRITPASRGNAPRRPYRCTTHARASVGRFSRAKVTKVAINVAPEISIPAPEEVLDPGALGVRAWTLLPDGRCLVGLNDDRDVKRYDMVLNRYFGAPHQIFLGGISGSMSASRRGT